MTQEKRYINNSKQLKALILICIAVIVLLCACKSEKHTHELTIVAGEKATCTEAGIEDYYTCGACDALFADANGKERIDSPKVVDATGHMYGNWTVITSPSREEKGEICAVCQYCDDQKTAQIPAVSVANGYTLVSYGKNFVWTYSFEGNTIEIQLDEKVETYSFSVADNDPFSECKGTVTDGGAYSDGSKVEKKENKRGIFYQKTKGATFTTRITVSEATDVAFIIRVCSAGGNAFAYDQAVTSVLLNDKTDGVIRNTGTVTTNGWDVSASAEISVATLSLEEGENILSFTMGTDTSKDLNVAIIEFVSNVPVELAAAKHTVKTDAAVKASCVMDGLTRGMHCSTCDKVLVKQNTIPSLGGHEWNGTICGICNAVKFEAETAVLDADSTKVGVGLEKDLEKCNFPSGDAFVWNIEKADNCSLTFYVHASEDTTAVLSYCLGLSKRNKASDLFHITVNGEKCAYTDPVVTIPRYNDAGVTRYYGWSEYEVATIPLKKGDNVLVLTKNKIGLNFDYIALRSTATLQDSREVANKGHNYSGWTVLSSPTYEATGKIGAYCEYCREYMTAEIPAVSVEKGYRRISYGEVSTWSYTYENEAIEVTVAENAEVYSFAVVDNDPFIDCRGKVVASGSKVNKHSNKYGTFYQKAKGATFTTTITVPEATDAALIIRVCSTKKASYEYDKAITSVLLNGKKDGVMMHAGKVTTNGWYTNTAAGINIATLSLNEGENVITFTMGTETKNDLNIAGIEFVAPVPVDIAPAKHTVVVDAAVEPSCVVSGLTEGEHCAECKEVFIAQNEIPSFGGHKWNGTICETCNAVRFEAETAVLDTDSTSVGVGLEKDLEKCNFPSGDAFVWNIEKADNCSLTFYVHASEDTTAVLSYCLGLNKRCKASELFDITLNGEACEYYEPVVEIPDYRDADVTRYYGWSEYEVATIHLKKGDNVLVLTKNENGLNFDYIALRSSATLQDSREVANQGHNYSGWTVLSSPTYEADGEIGAYCEYCRDHITTKIPAVSVENGYTKIKSAPTSVWNYSYSGEQIEILVQEQTAIYSFTVADNDPFEDCKGTVTDGGIYTDGSTVEKISNHRGTFYQKTKGAMFTTTMTVPEATEVVFSVRVCGVKGVTTDYAQAIQSVWLNGQTDGVVLNNGTVKTNGWDVASASEISVATLSLKEGENTITFTMGSDTETDLNVTSIEFKSCVSVDTVNKHTPVVDAAVEPTCVAAGFTEGSHCSVCGHVIVEQEEIPMVSHVDLQPIDNACDACGAEGNVYAFWVADNDPFANSNGGSVSGDAVNKYTNNRGTAYQKTQGATFTTTVNVSEKTGIKFAVKIVGNIGEHPVTDIISSVKLGDRELTIDNGTANLNSWNVIEAADVFVVSMILEKGINKISFTMGNLNANVAGILVTSFVPVECAGS